MALTIILVMQMASFAAGTRTDQNLDSWKEWLCMVKSMV
jgi:hypothetical protein